MAESLKSGEILFRIHGPDIDREEMLPASLFAYKLAVFVRALKAADRGINGEVRHDYKIAKLSSSAPTVRLAERARPRYEGQFLGISGIDAFKDCANAITTGDRDSALKYGRCAEHIRTLSRGASRTFGYGEIWTPKDKFIRVDSFLSEQTTAVVSPEEYRRTDADGNWYKGAVDASFDGSIKAVDLRGRLPEIKLILTAGGKQLDCVCLSDDLEKIKSNLDGRVRIFGRAIYDGKSGLPRRVEVREIEAIKEEADFSVWKNSFHPFEPPDWDIDEP